MNILLIIIILLICVIFLSILCIYIFKNNSYKEIFNIKNIDDLRKHFLLDNPNMDGSDPTHGMVDYGFMFKKDANGTIIENINGDTSWQEIPVNPSLIENYDEGIKIKLDKEIKNGKVGAPRLISRKLFKGGLFIFDIEHCPVGCGLWPALWLNGFVGGKDQYHEKKGTKKYKEGITKLAKSTITKEKYNKTCKNPLISNSKPDENLSEYLGKNVFVAMWPVGGEIDILEQTNFSDTNLVSVHGGPICEVVNGYDNNYYIKDENIDLDYRNSGVRSVCGVTYWNGGLDPNNPGSYGIGPYSGCKDNTHKIGELGGSKSITKNGVKRYNCPKNAATSAGNSQVVAPVGSFGTVFNQNGGGVYVVDWSPKKHLNIWWFSRQFYSKDFLSTKNGPLSSDPKPDKWSPKMFPSIKNTMGKYKKQKVLIASYILNSNNALNEGCDFNYQGITINISLGGDWAGNVMPKYCSVDYKSEWTDYIPKCYNASAKRASKNGVDPKNSCYDGGMSSQFRGSNAKPIFYSESYFKIRNIRVLQKEGDDNIW